MRVAVVLLRAGLGWLLEGGFGWWGGFASFGLRACEDVGGVESVHREAGGSTVCAAGLRGEQGVTCGLVCGVHGGSVTELGVFVNWAGVGSLFWRAQSDEALGSSGGWRSGKFRGRR